MEKIALIGDIHFNRKAENPIIKKYIKDGQRKFFDFVVKELKERKVKIVLFTGDIHDNRITIDVEALVHTKRLLQEKFKDFDIHIILGNHDMYYDNSYDISALELFEDIPNVTVYRDTVVKKSFFGKEWYFIPWLLEKNEEKFIGFLKKLAETPVAKRDNTVLFGHFEMLDINMEGGNISTFGLDSNLFFNAAKMTISGHYHGLSAETKSGNELLYLGSPYPMTFANADQKHGIWILNEDLTYDFIENTISPKFTDVWDTDLDTLTDKDVSNSFVRFYMSNDRTMEESFEMRLIVESKNPLIIKKIPYSGEKKEIAQKTEVQREANRLLGMDTLKLSEVWIEQNSEDLPELSMGKASKDLILDKIKSFKKELNLV